MLPRPSFAWRTPASAADMWMLSPIPHEPLLKAGPPSLKLRDTETYSQKPAYGEARPAGGYRTGRADPNACGIKLRTQGRLEWRLPGAKEDTAARGAIGNCAAGDPAITSPAVNNETCDVGVSVARMRSLRSIHHCHDGSHAPRRASRRARDCGRVCPRGSRTCFSRKCPVNAKPKCTSEFVTGAERCLVRNWGRTRSLSR